MSLRSKARAKGGAGAVDLLAAAPDDRAAIRELARVGFGDPNAALRNLHALTPTPREAGLLRPAVTWRRTANRTPTAYCCWPPRPV